MSLLNQDVKVVWSDLKRAFAAIKPRRVEELSMSLVVTLFLVLAFGTYTINNSPKVQYAAVYLAQNTISANSIITPTVSGVVLGEQTGSGGLTQANIDAILSLLRSFNASEDVVNNVSIALTGKQFSTAVRFCHAFAQDLTVGHNGDAVSALQYILQKEGFLSTSESDKGTFGEEEAAAVVQLQAKYGIRQTGYVGPLTRAKLNALYGCVANTTSTEQPIPAVRPVPTLGVVTEQVKCVFNGATTEQKCYTATSSDSSNWFTCSGVETCVADVKGLSGQQLTWKSSCGGYAYTKLDGQMEYASFSCGTTTQSSITVLSPNGGESFQVGSSAKLSWTSSNVPLDNGGFLGIQNIVTGTEVLRRDIAVNGGSLSNYGGSFPWIVSGAAGQYRLTICSNDLSNPAVTGKPLCDSSDSYFKIYSENTQPPISVKIIDGTTYGNAGDAFVRLSIGGYPTNKQVHHWVLGYTCSVGVTLDTGKSLLCDEVTSGKSALTYYAYNIYDVTTDYLMITAGAQNKNTYPSQITFTLEARDSNDKTLGSSDTKIITLNPANTTQPSITSISPASGLPGSQVTLYGSGFKLASRVNIAYGSAPVVNVDPSGTKLNFVVPSTTAPGSYKVSVTNNDGTPESNTVVFTVTSTTTQSSTGTVLGEQTSASTLTQLQIDAVIALLRSLGVEQGALNNVDTSLHGGIPAF